MFLVLDLTFNLFFHTKDTQMLHNEELNIHTQVECL